MPAPKHRHRKTFAGAVACCVALAVTAHGQGTPTQRPSDQDEVVRIYTELVQTDVMVFDKQGKFVNALKREDFVLKIDGKARPIDFLDHITAGSASEEVQLAAARGVSSTSPRPAGKGPLPLDRGRAVFFFVDDLHLALGSLVPTRKLISHFIETELGQNDEAAITSTSGQIGFLQQLTDNKTVLRAAVERLSPHEIVIRDMERPLMSEYQALQIDRNDQDLLGYFIEQFIRDNPGIPRGVAGDIVRKRASRLLQQAAHFTTSTMASLEQLVKACADLPGRKLVFFVSDGFFIENRESDALDRLRQIASAAARSGVVIYSMDARGLVADFAPASERGNFDPTGRLARAAVGELFASQDGMNALAKDTGGQTIFNTNALDVGLAKALKETSTYYLLAWRPDADTQGSGGGKFRHIEVSLVGHPDLTVRVRRGFFDIDPAPNLKLAAQRGPVQAEPPPEVKLREAINNGYPDKGLPLALNLNYLNTPDKGALLTTSMELASEFLTFATVEGKQRAVVNVAGGIYNDQGKAASTFAERLTITANTPDQEHLSGREFVYSHPLYLKPGLYQVRVGMRDDKSGKVGTAHQWIDIPDLSLHQLSLSSLIAGERNAETTPSVADNSLSPMARVPVRVNHHFHNSSFLRFVFFIYNSVRAQSDSKPDVAVQIQVLRDDQPVMTTSLKRVPTDLQDLDRLAYAADVPLEGLTAGRYVLKVTAIDRVSKTSASQRMRFEVE